MGAPGPRLNPAVAAVRSAVRAGLDGVPGGALVLVACSGGPDSTALAAAVAFVAPRAGVRAGAVVVDHGWSGDSAGVAAGAAAMCRSLGLDPVDVVRVDCTGPGGPEAAARAARYRALDDVAHRRGAVAVLLGHTLDDQAETVLLALARGSGTRSLAGMPARRGIHRRPLLGLTRADTATVCAELALPVWTDPSNTDPAYRRSRVRSLLPGLDAALGPGLAGALARTAEIAREDADALDALAADLLDRACPPPAGPDVAGPDVAELDVAGLDVAGLDVEVLAGAPVAVRHRVLLLAARRAGCPAGSLGRVHVLAIDALVTRWHGQGAVDLPGGASAVRACGRLVLTAGDPS